MTCQVTQQETQEPGSKPKSVGSKSPVFSKKKQEVVLSKSKPRVKSSGTVSPVAVERGVCVGGGQSEGRRNSKGLFTPWAGGREGVQKVTPKQHQPPALQVMALAAQQLWVGHGPSWS